MEQISYLGYRSRLHLEILSPNFPWANRIVSLFCRGATRPASEHCRELPSSSSYSSTYWVVGDFG